MRKLSATFILVLAFCCKSTAIPPVSESTASNYLNERGEVYFSFPVTESENFDVLLKTISVERIKDGRVIAYANAYEFDAFLQYAIDYLVHIPPGLQMAEKQYSMRSSVDVSDISSWDFYPTYEAYESMMEQFASKFPDLCRLVNIQTLDSGRSLLFLKISGGIDNDHARPRFMYTSTMHGDEPPGFNLMLRLIHHLLNEYGEDEMVTYLLDRLEIWICPNENPDGTYRNDNNTIFGGTRSNSSGIDLNRNYPTLINENTTPIQPETLAMIALTDSLQFVMSANIHSGIECVNYPYDQWESQVRKHADHYWWQFVSHEYADTARHYSPAGYMNPFGSGFYKGVTHGGDWYVVDGSRQDYMNYFAKQRELTLELSNSKLPPTSVLPALWDYNYRSLLNYMYQSVYGINGVVRDGAEAKNLFANIELTGYDDDVSGVLSSLPGGNFHRPLLEGVYDVMISSEGYLSKYFFDLEVTNYEAVSLDVDLGMLSFDPMEVVFDPAVAGGVSYQPIHITNNSDESLSIILEGFTGDPAFSYNVATKMVINIAAGAQESIELWFNPADPGSYYGALAITLDIPHQPQVFLPLIGDALTEAALLYAVTPVLDFGMLNLDQSHTLDLSVRNTGNISLEITDIVISNDAFSVDISTPYSLAAGEFADIPVVFSPESAQTYTATLSFESNASNDNYEVVLLGMGSDNTWVSEPGQHFVQAHIYPNPIRDISFLQWYQDFPGPVLIKVYDKLGNNLSSKHYDISESGTHHIAIGSFTHQLPPGIYLLQILSKNTSETVRLIKTTSGH